MTSQEKPPSLSLGEASLASLGLLLASISVALFYNITFFGKALVALPSVLVTGGCLLYYLSAFNTTPPHLQVALWMVSFLISGWIWWEVLKKSSERWKPELTGSTRRKLAWLPWLYLPPLPWLLWVHAQSSTGLSLQALVDAILVRDRLYWSSQGSETWLNALYLGLAALETVLTFALLKRERKLTPTLLLMSLAGSASLLVLCALAEVAVRLH